MGALFRGVVLIRGEALISIWIAKCVVFIEDRRLFEDRRLLEEIRYLCVSQLFKCHDVIKYLSMKNETHFAEKLEK